MLSYFKPLLAAILAGVMASSLACAAPATAPPHTPKQLRADFDALYAGLRDAHFELYARRSRADYDALFDRIRAELDAPLSDLEVWKRFQRFVAYGNIAHARIDPPAAAWEAFRKDGGKAFPLFLRIVQNKAYISDDYSGVPGVSHGDEVISVQGLPVQTWLDRMRALLSADNRYLADTQLETQLPVLVWLDGGEQAEFALVLAKSDGSRVELTLPARSRAEFEAAAATRAKRFELDWNERKASVLDGGLAYLRPGPFYDNRPDADHPWDPTAFATFLDRAFADFIRQGADRLLIDLRDNPGGDNSFSDPLLAWIADKPFRFTEAFDIKVSAAATASNRKRLDAAGADSDSTSARLAAAYAGKTPGSRVNFPIPLVAPREGERYAGRVFVLVNRHSYSNTVLVAAIAQDYRFGTVLGEETSDLASTYGALEKFTLPHTGLEVSFPKARILRPNGDAQARGVIPDIAIATPLIGSARDVVLERAVAIVALKSTPQTIPALAKPRHDGSH